MAREKDSFSDLLWQLAFQVRSRCQRAVAESGFTLYGMHVRLLHLIAAEPLCRAQTLVAASGRDKAQIARLLKDLQGQGLLAREPHPEDGRSQMITLTEQGRELLTKVRAAEQAVESEFLAKLTERETETFVRLGRKMLAP
ncbi:MarR family winged helix-turn-helix transcriptional regulator [Gilvimarinus sp. DA14]|uniref:MarR family winged helix-turn-helix transcriptional regulator n=1 Tax=Gilvimarinus sp. DA14 TaxID=2956798 RepID=UPI0020B64ED4|nr:MarR family transcriptional regulator [Gilvimarinus sp. DA14]UTF61567.1 MarR family transcriptional regulator [Gilvimarinus sp. DA14]